MRKGFEQIDKRLEQIDMRFVASLITGVFAA
jgi:hypothetical protein